MEEGYITHSLLLSLYNDDEEIPDFIIDLACHKPEPPKMFQLYMSPKMYKEFSRACEDFLMSLAQKQIADEMKSKNCKS